MNFDESVQYLLGLGHETLAMKLGLKTTSMLLEVLDSPEQSFSSVQIAGTNGKGSVAAFLNSICLAANIKTGLYTSPHLSSITERIKINGVEIGQEQFALRVSEVRAAAESLVASRALPALPTFFEQVTVAALLAFREAKVELAILETGLGGRLDSTTAAKAEVVAITPIDMDHEEYLGDTIESIATEKAAIIRPGSIAVVSQQRHDALEVIISAAAANGVTPIIVNARTRDVHPTNGGTFFVTLETNEDIYENMRIALRGEHQIGNAAVSIALAEQLRRKGFEITNKAIVDGIQGANHPGRLEIFKEHDRHILLDGAHNPAGAQTLRRYLETFGTRPLVIVFGAMREKKIDQLARIIFPLADHIILTTVRNARSATVSDLLKLAGDLKVQATVVDSSTQALELARKSAGSAGLICVTGSLYLIGELRQTITEVSSKVAPSRM